MKCPSTRGLLGALAATLGCVPAATPAVGAPEAGAPAGCYRLARDSGQASPTWARFEPPAVVRLRSDSGKYGGLVLDPQPQRTAGVSEWTAAWWPMRRDSLRLRWSFHSMESYVVDVGRAPDGSYAGGGGMRSDVKPDPPRHAVRLKPMRCPPGL